MNEISIVSDATSLIILGKLERYDLLRNIFKKIIIPQEVMREISKKTDGVYEKIIENHFFEIKKITNIALLSLLDGILDRGECEAIILANELNHLLLIDEKKGRSVAKGMGLNIIGLIGILLLNIKKGALSKKESIEIFTAIKNLNFRVSKTLEKHFLLELKKIQ